MKMQRIVFIAAVMLSVTAAVGAAVETDTLLKSIDTLKTYEYGKTNGVDLNWVDKEVAMASKDASIRGQVEDKLIATLAAATTNDAKQFLCRQLRTIGTARAVPQLESMLTNPEISHMARYALGKIDAPEAGQALHRALGKTSGKVKAGIINTLAQIEYSDAAPDIIKLVSDADKDVAIAAIRAAGGFGGARTVIALQKARPSAAKDLQVEINAALLKCAANFAAEGNAGEAGAIYEEFYSGKYPGYLRVAGLRGLAATRGEAAADLLVEAIKGDDADLRRNAIGMMALIKGEKTTQTFVELSKSLPADGQELIVRSLAERADASAAPAIIEMAGNENENVRLAALEALGGMGTPQAVEPLAKAAATAGETERQVARASLVRIKGEGVDEAIIKAANSGEADRRVEVIRAIGQRGDREPFSVLLKTALTDAEASVRHEAVLSMARIGEPADIDVLVKLTMSPKDPGDRSAIERAIVIMFGKMPDDEAQARSVIAVLDNAPNEAKPVLLSLLTRPATSEALDAVRAGVQSSDAEVSDAAIRALGEWPNAAPAEEIYKIAQTSSNPAHKLLALRSYIRMAPLTQDPMGAYAKAMKLVTRKDEIKLVLGGLHHAGSREALELAEKYTTDEDLKAEAYVAMAKVADVYCWQDGPRAKAALDKVIAEAPNDGIRNQAGDVIKKMERYKGLIVAWRGAGPYRIEGVNDGRTVFERPFAPEKDPGDKDTVWQIVLPEFEGDNRINLEKTFGQIDYCCAYLRTTIHSPIDQEAKINWSVDDYIKGWINGKAAEGGNIELRQGANSFMLKVGDHGGGWSFRCRLTRPDDTAIEGLRFLPE
ncbi:MAG TPA: HEAT repeat domain-containing protein [Sedimentisphaerales bacterium]|nr:HEAT repeat domain-containing protein [Sedimentisphaerales bacterium]